MNAEQAAQHLKRHTEQRLELGDFLTAVLENNLRNAVLQADEDSRRNLVAIVLYVRDELPGLCWGNPERVRDWLACKDILAPFVKNLCTEFTEKPYGWAWEQLHRNLQEGDGFDGPPTPERLTQAVKEIAEAEARRQLLEVRDDA